MTTHEEPCVVVATGLRLGGSIVGLVDSRWVLDLVTSLLRLVLQVELLIKWMAVSQLVVSQLVVSQLVVSRIA